VCIYRIPRDISIIKPSSFCPSCKRPIKFYDNIPIISYFVLKGKCRYCGNPISVQYPLVEFITGVLTLLLFLRFGLSKEFFFLLPFICSLIVITFIDFQHQIIPDIITIPGAISGMLLHLLTKEGALDSILGLLVGGGSLLFISLAYMIIYRKEGMGGGDIKLMAMIGAWLGIRSVLPVIMIGAFSGSIYGLIKNRGRGGVIPFGPFLSLGAIVYIFFQDAISKFLL